MTTSSFKLLGAVGAIALAAGAAIAQTAPQTPATTQPTSNASTTPAANAAGKVVMGANVMDTKGGQVGTIKSVDGEYAVLSTGTNDVRLPVSSFAAGPNGPIIAMTKAEVDAAAGGAAADSKAKLAAALTSGTAVSDPQGGSVGTIESNDGQFVTVATAKNKVKLPASAFAMSPSGSGVMIGMTAAQLDAEAAKAASPAG